MAGSAWRVAREGSAVVFGVRAAKNCGENTQLKIKVKVAGIKLRPPFVMNGFSRYALRASRHYKSSLTLATTLSTVKPNFSIS